MASQPRLYLVDGSSQMYRAYHAIRGLTGPSGHSTNAVYGFVTMLRKLLNEQQPALIAAAFDLPQKTFRAELAADYKANRAPMPPDLAEQIPWVHEACEALGVPILTHERYEADDVIATIARRAADEGYEVAIVTGDKDFFQLVDDRIKVFNPRDDGTWYDAGGVKARFGVTPSQVVDVLALMGDSIDNIKGVPGIGEKGAKDLIATYGTLDALLEHAGEVKQKKYREALLQYGESARQSRELVRLHTTVPIEFTIEAFRFRGASRERCFELFSRLGFRSLTAEYAPTAENVERDYAALSTIEEVAALARELEAADRFSLRLLVDGPSAMQATLVGLAVADRPRRVRYVPFRQEPASSAATLLGAADDAQAGHGLDPAAVLRALRGVLEDPSVAKIGHDLKFELVVLARRGIALDGIGDDTMLESYVYDATRSSHELEDLALEQVSYKAKTAEDICGKGAKAIPFRNVSPDVALLFAGERADLALQLAGPMADALEREGLTSVYRTLELPLIPVLAALEQAGIRLDAKALAAQSSRIESELAARSARIFELAGMEFNINSPRQLSEVLFDRLQLPALKRTGKTRTASTAVEVLEELAILHELPREILEWRALQKLKGTYIDALPQLVHPETGRVHTCFNQAVAATGRLSSSDPNLQNIPIRTEVGREIRGAFVADPGNVLISADYSQIELRVLAHLSADESLIDAFRRHEDIHDRTSMKVFGPDSGLSRHELRRRAKIINYALLYGKTAYTLAKDIGVTQQAAQEFIDAYFAGFPAVRQFIDQTIANARERGAVYTMFGRRRLVPELRSRNGQIRAAAERATVNMPIQGTAADILKLAMIDLHRELSTTQAGIPERERARMILTVHDELLFECPRSRADEVADLVRSRMEHVVQLAVPLTVDIGIGENWKEAKG